MACGDLGDDEGVTKAEWEAVGEAMAETGESVLRGGFARCDRDESEIEGTEVGVFGEMGDGRGIFARQGRQKNNSLLAEASAYVRYPAHLQWALAIQPSHWTESGWRLVLRQRQHIHVAALYLRVSDMAAAEKEAINQSKRIKNSKEDETAMIEASIRTGTDLTGSLRTPVILRHFTCCLFQSLFQSHLFL